MQYFDTLPKILHTDNNGISRIFTNIIARASILPKILNNPMVYYKYDIQDGDTPEIIAHKYYGESYRYWIVMFANQLLDPRWDWPMSGRVFNKFILEKYPETNVYNTVHHYEKIITKTDSDTNVTTTDKIIIDENTYTLLQETTGEYDLPYTSVKVSVSKRAVSIYDYELELNESKRTINILNVAYVDQLEVEFMKLMRK